MDADEAMSEFGVMSCYRAWSYWVARLDAGGYQVRHVVQRRERLTRDQMVECLCEIYARGLFETALSVHFEGVDSKGDAEVLDQITLSFGEGVMRDVVRLVAEHGPTLGERAEAPADPVAEVP